MIIEDDQIEIQLDDYIRSKPETIPDPEIAQLADYYKRQIAQKLQPITPDMLDDIKNHKSKLKLGKTLYVSIKVDGESVLFIYNKDDSGDYRSYFCNASTHRVWVGLPANKQLENLLDEKGIEKAIIPGELYAVPENPPDFDARGRVYDFIHFSRNPDSSEDLQRIGFRAFDLIRLDEEEFLNKPYDQRYTRMKEIFGESGRVAMVRTHIIGEHELSEYFEQVVTDGGAEGLVIRNSETFLGYKVKPLHNLDVVIIGAVAGIEGSRVGPDQLSSTLVALRYPDGTYQIITKVGGGITDEQRRHMWANLHFVDHSGFVGATSDGRAFRMVKPEYVATIDYLDIIVSNLNNQPIMQNTLAYDEEKDSWEILRPMPFVTLISPRFNSDAPLREDKRATVEDVRVAQVTDLVDLDPVESIQAIDLPDSEIISRYVFEKKDAVRKFLLISTNKSELDPRYPKYVVFHTDYSPDRKIPLERKVLVSNDEDQIWSMFETTMNEEMLGKDGGLKRGWATFDVLNNSSHQIEIGDGTAPKKSSAKKTTKSSNKTIKSSKKSTKKTSKKKTTRKTTKKTTKKV